MEQTRDLDRHFMSAKRLQTELLRCEFCEEKPCMSACPANCSPADFIMAARVGNPSDLQRSAGEIMRNNPLGGVCGLVCPDRFCMAACSRKKFDGAINIPQVQATVVQMAKELGGIPKLQVPAPNGKKVAVVGGGPVPCTVISDTGATATPATVAVSVSSPLGAFGGTTTLI